MSRTGSKTALAVIVVLALLLTAVMVQAAEREKDGGETKSVVAKGSHQETLKQTEGTIESATETESGLGDLVGGAAASENTPAAAGTKAGEEVHWQAITSGGGRATVGSYRLVSSIGQPVVGLQTVGSYTLRSGFLQDFGAAVYCCVIRGDINHDSSPIIDIVDLVYMVNYMFKEGPEPICFWEADINGDGSPIIDIVDLVYMVNYMFKEGPDPAPCP